MPKLVAVSIKMLYRDKQALFWALAFPIMFAVVFGLFNFDQAPEIDVAVVVRQPTPVSAALLTGMREVETFTVTTPRSEATARADLSAGDLDVVIVVPAEAGTAASPPLQVLYDESNFQVNQLAISTVRQLVDGLNLEMAGVRTPAIAIAPTPVEARSVEYYDVLLPGLVAMGVMNFSIIGMGVAVAQFRHQRILKRILATPLAPVRFLTAQVVARLLLSLVQAALILAVGVFLFGANVYGNVVWLFVLATVANLIFLNIGFAVAGRAPNPDAAQGMGNAIALPMMFLSGVFFPTDTLPEVLQSIVKFLPLTPLIEALRAVSVDGETITAVGTQLLMLGAWVLVSFGIAARNFRFSSA